MTNMRSRPERYVEPGSRLGDVHGRAARSRWVSVVPGWTGPDSRVELRHVLRVASLPFHHRDPVDARLQRKRSKGSSRSCPPTACFARMVWRPSG